ncbi:response regulator transcription factor [Flavobacteriaceae bacterium TP-CH-4]|uniref:Response regulator transcription factor n=1 Tax=Pelagihabitans pacificus TaxID=2696054 RepID=A0A967B3C9_9FLAO|nr:response regulator transcription factor [Pelagihabitans pacificus]
MGIGFFQYAFSTTKNHLSVDSQKKSPKQKQETPQNSQSSVPISHIPIKKGENILFVPIENIVYFEAFDNYSFVYDKKGEKKLCDYSLLFLETRLGEEFSRVHRKYIVNKGHIEQIKPHLNGRYVILFGNQISPVMSSKSYSATIRKLIKIE